MGYESRLYIVEKHKSSSYETINGHVLRWAEVITTLNMCAFPKLSVAFYTFGKDTDCYIYETDGNTRIIEDKYGKPLRELPISEVIKCIEEYEKTNRHYRRCMPVLGLLKGFDPSEWEDLVVLHYGY